MENIRLALDWTPNTNHTGFFYGMKKGFYSEMDINLVILSPNSDNYQRTPAKKVEMGDADVAIAPIESVISYRTKANPVKMRAVAALLREDLSALCVKKGVNRPAELDGKLYGSYKARYEDGIIRELIKNDGGQGEIGVTYPPKLSIWQEFLDDKIDFTWIFKNWESLDQGSNQDGLNYFNLRDYGIPYGYSPILMCTEEAMESKREALRNFLQATKKGFLESAKNPVEAANTLQSYLPPADMERMDVLSAQKYVSQFYGDETNWGVMEPEKVSDFLNWLKKRGLERTNVAAEELYTNSLILPF